MKKYLLVVLIFVLGGCSRTEVKVEPIEYAPEINLSDSLSSTVNEFKLKSGNCTWNYLDGEETVSLIACGSHPLNIAQTAEEKLKLPHYNKIDFVPYRVSCVVEPDQIIVKEWDRSQIGENEAEVLASTLYEEAFIIDLKPNRVYELILTWDEENFATNGCYGEASYSVVTEKQ